MGLPLSSAAREEVEALVARVRASMALDQGGGSEPRPVRWVRTDGLHVTVRFLGPTLPERLAGVERAVAATAAAERPFQLTLHGGGGFPRPDRPRTLWLQITQGEAELAELARHLDDHLAQEQWPRDGRPFRAHLTLARSDGVRAGPDTLRRLVAEAERLDVSWQAEELVLFESLTGGGPARYEPLLRTPFGEGAGSGGLSSPNDAA